MAAPQRVDALFNADLIAEMELHRLDTLRCCKDVHNRSDLVMGWMWVVFDCVHVVCQPACGLRVHSFRSCFRSEFLFVFSIGCM